MNCHLSKGGIYIKGITDLSEATGFKRVYDYKNYTYWRIVEILKDHYNAYLEEIMIYKGNRIPNYHKRYRIYNIDTKELIAENIYLDDLRRVFAKQDYPKIKPDIEERNKGAEAFLEAVKNIKKVEDL